MKTEKSRVFLVWLCGILVLLASCKAPSVDVSPLMVAVIENDNETIEKLSGSKQAINEVDKQGNTALMYALGIHITKPDSRSYVNGSVPEEDTEILRMLLESGADPNIENSEGGTPLVLSIYHGALASVGLLLDYGANPNYKNKQGRTPLMYAAIHCNPEIAALLLRQGADPDARSANGNQTAKEISAESKCAKVEEILTKWH